MKYDSIFNRDFYPTPDEVLDMMELDVSNRIVLEPSAGKGNIIDYCKRYGAHQVLFCEINRDLAQVCQNKGTQIGTDFLELKSEDVSSVDIIVMNPPFSEFKKHIFHAWSIAPAGCEIVSLCNYESIRLRHLQSELYGLIDNYGYVQNLGDVFKDAERQTGVQIGLIRVFKPVSTESIDFDSYFDSVDDDLDINQIGLVQYNEIDALVNSYKAIVRLSDNIFRDAGLLVEYSKHYKLILDITIGVKIDDNIRINQVQFLRKVQTQMWHRVFDLFNIRKYLTSGVINDLNSWIQRKGDTPFTKRNIYKMVELLFQVRGQLFQNALIEAVDYFTRFTHENRYNVEGWKTNAGYLLNQKFIVTGLAELNWSETALRFKWGNSKDHIEDLKKVICNIIGMNYDNIDQFDSRKEYDWGVWYDSEIFEYKMFKKGTVHFKFKDRNVWEQVNRAYAQAKGNVLPEKL